MMEIILYGMLCANGTEHDCAYKLLAMALRKEFGIKSMPMIAWETGGKPFFPGIRDLYFNISHSHGAVVVALHDKPVGVDVEKLRPAPKRLSAGMDDRDFFRRWTKMEATVKKRGGSIAAILRHEVEGDPLCRTLEDVLPGWIVTVCPAEECGIRCEVAGEEFG